MYPLRVLFALVLAVQLAGTSSVLAQNASGPPAPSIAIVDVESIMRDSLAVKSARSQLDVIAKDLQTDIAVEEEALQADQQKLQQQRALLAPEKYAQERKALQERAAALQQRARSLRQTLDRGMAQTMQRIQILLFEEVGKLAEEMGINLVLPRSQIVVAIDSFNISEKALERMNARLSEVDLALERNGKK
jgi:outer membrane protein